MEEITIEIRKREYAGKGIAHRIRALGYIPAVVYGPHIDTFSAVVEPEPVKKVIMEGPKGINTPLTLKMADSDVTYKAVVKAYQKDPVTRRILHCDFWVYSDGDQVMTQVPLRFVGKSKGVEKGGRLRRHLYEVKVKGVPELLPASIDVDITNLDINQQVKLDALPVPEGIRLIYRHNTPVVSIQLGRGTALQEEEAGEAEQEAPAEGTENK